jgi:hypothetical protein
MSGSNVDDRAFFRQYAAEIAEAFREQEEAPRQASLEESVPDLYRSLCFDEPMIESEAANFSIVVSGLSRQLISSSSPYALSDRLVNGILYLSKRKDTSDTKSNTAPTQESIAMAKLAFCVLVQLPLQICQNFGNLSAVRKCLGSYKGSLVSAEDKNSVVNADDSTRNDSAIQQRVNKITEAINGTGDMTVYDAQDDSVLKEVEVWAAESDPSEYDYGEGVPDHPPHGGFQFQEEDWLDPPRLSKPDPALSKDQARLAVGSLLNQANYNVLEPIFALSKKEVEKYTSELSQLILILLQPQNPLGNGDANMDLPLQDAILSPLWILRDAAIHSVSTQQRQSFSSSYLEVLQTLLAVDQAHLQDLGGAMSNKNVELCTASIVGLSAMSSWCGMSEISIPSTITSVLDAMNDISYVVERASEKYKSSLLHSLVPIVELLSGITFDQAQTAGISNSNSIAQTLMSSGFLRQLLVLGLEEGIENAHRFHHALWGLSVSHPKIAGKYVARYPGTPQFVRGYTVAAESSSQDCVSSILWNGFGLVHSEGPGQTQAPRVVWKTSSAKQTVAALPLSRDECTEVCQKSWTRLCQIVESSMMGSSKEPEKALEALHDWERFLSFMTVASMASTFVELLDSSHLQKIVKALSVSISQQQQQQQQHVQEEEKAEAAIDDSTDDTVQVDDPDGKLKSPKSNHQMIIARARKLIKQYTLIFQGNLAGSSKTD